MKTARLVHPGFWFGKTPLEEALVLARHGVGGFCLYGGTRAQITDFVNTVRNASPLPYLLISADYEDGLGRWVPDAPLLASNMSLGAANDPQLAFEKGFLTAQQARSLGVDWIFAPVVDLANNPLNPIVNTRSFGKDPSLVIRLAQAFLEGIRKGGALSSLKHFPGHGDTSTDSHLALPVLHKDKAQLARQDLAPFQALLNKADSVMAGHLFLPEIDGENPASLSKKLLQEFLRNDLGYEGCVLTDALLMKAIGDEKQAALKALQAGVDILLVPEKPLELLDFLEKNPINPAFLAHSEQVQNKLCDQARQMPRPSSQTAFIPHPLNQQVAQKGIVQQGNLPRLQPGQSVAFLEIGNTAGTSSQPFLQVLKDHHLKVKKYPEPAELLVILCFRRYQAFQGKVTLELEEQTKLKEAASGYTQTVCVLLSSPWALNGVIKAPASLYTFCPAPEFQQQAAAVLLGQQKACDTLPVDL